MSDSGNAVQPYTDAWLGYLNQVNGIVDTAINDDAKGNWGSDAWVRLIHNLIDAQIRAYALLVQTSLAGPLALQTPTGLKSPRPSAPITVPEATYARTIRTSGLVRLGLPGVKLPADCVRFYPKILKAGQTTFRVGLTNFNYVGANYTGKVELYKADAAPGGAPDSTYDVTVGL
jgi:hypothetical protein